MLLFALPLYAIALVYGAAALLPAIYLMRYIYRKDTVEKEPPMLLMSLLIYGVIAALISIILENIGTKVLNSLMDQSTVGYTLVLAFAVVAVVEEGAKFAMLKRRTWNDMNFNYRFDGIVYAVFVSLGFAAFENIGYVLGYGLSVAPGRCWRFPATCALAYSWEPSTAGQSSAGCGATRRRRGQTSGWATLRRCCSTAFTIPAP